MMEFFWGRFAGESPHAASPRAVSPNTPAGPARPIRLVYIDEKGRFQMDPEAVALLQLVKGPVAVVSVCGRALQGKSFILNQLLGRSSGFQVASTHRPCTKGLWLWSTPLRRTALDGTEYSLLLLDSEGIDANDQTAKYSTQIFSLAVLLLSIFMYNQMGGTDKAALDHLSLVIEMTKHILLQTFWERNTTLELGEFSPIFIWLLRDFYLDLVDDNHKITPCDYLELALRLVDGGGRDVTTKNKIRESIRALFPNRECFTLVRPVNNENDLQRLDQIPLDKLRPEFRAGLDSLRRFVFEKTRPKQMGGTLMTGPLFALVTQSFLDALNNGAVPTITCSFQAAELKIWNYDLETSKLNLEIKDLHEQVENAHSTALKAENKALILEEEKRHFEWMYKLAEKNAEMATKMAEQARADAITAWVARREFQRLAMDRLQQIETAEMGVEKLKYTLKERERRVEMLEDRVRQRTKRIDSLFSQWKEYAEELNRYRDDHIKLQNSCRRLFGFRDVGMA